MEGEAKLRRSTTVTTERNRGLGTGPMTSLSTSISAHQSSCSARRLCQKGRPRPSSLTSLSFAQHTKLLFIIQSPPLPRCSSKRFPNAPLFLLTLRGTRVVFLSHKNNRPPKLRQRLKIFLTLLIRLFSGEVEAGETRPRVDEGARGRDHVRVRLPLLIAVTDGAALNEHMPFAYGLHQDAELMRIICDALATDGDTGSASDPHVFTPFVATLLPRRITSVIARVCTCAGRGCAWGDLMPD